MTAIHTDPNHPDAMRRVLEEVVAISSSGADTISFLVELNRVARSAAVVLAAQQQTDEGSVPASRMTVQNPIEDLRLAALDAYPDLECDVGFAAMDAEGPYGVTVFPDDGGRPQVLVAVGIPLEATIEVMAHELAHVVAGIEADHGPAWEEAFARIHASYLARIPQLETST